VTEECEATNPLLPHSYPLQTKTFWLARRRGAGSLSSFLKNTKKSSNDSEVSWLPRESVSRGGSEASKLNWALEIANGVLYLHSQPVPVLHRDLKAANILLDHGLHCKITDFGESTEKALTHNPKDSMTTVGTPYFMAPELFESIPNYNSKVDVYAFAVLLLEIHMDGVLSAAFANMNPMVAIKAITMDMWRPDLKVLLANCEIPEIAGLIESCWQQKPGERAERNEAKQSAKPLPRSCVLRCGLLRSRSSPKLTNSDSLKMHTISLHLALRFQRIGHQWTQW